MPSFSASLQLMSGSLPLQQAWQSLAAGLELRVFLMVITHFVPGWIIPRWHCLAPRGEPHEVDPASQRATKTPKAAAAAPHSRPCAPQHCVQTHTHTHKMHACTDLDTQPLISYSPFQWSGRGRGVIKMSCLCGCIDANPCTHAVHIYKNKSCAFPSHVLGKVNGDVARQVCNVCKHGENRQNGQNRHHTLLIYFQYHTGHLQALQ